MAYAGKIQVSTSEMTRKKDAAGNRSAKVERLAVPAQERVERSAVLVLGMHRSGTSALAGLLTKLGCDGPATPMSANQMNPKGYFESDPIYRLHEEIFVSAGTSWDDFRPFPQSWLNSPKAGEYRSRMQELVATEYRQSNFFVVKDPRICRILPFWTELLEGMGIQPVAVHTHRNPVEVATSLAERDQIDRRYGELLWLCHVLEAEWASRDMPRAFTTYEKLVTNWAKEARRLGDTLGLTWPRFWAGNTSLEGFVEPKLKHVNADPAGVPQNELLPRWIRDSYSILQRWAYEDADPQDFPKLDAMRAEYSLNALIFGPVVQSRGKAILAHRENILRKLTEVEGSLKEQQAAAVRATTQTREIESELTAERERSRREISDLQDVLVQRTSDAEKLSAACADVEAQLSALALQHQQERRQVARLSAQLTRYRKEAEIAAEKANTLRSELREARRLLMRSHAAIQDAGKQTYELDKRLATDPSAVGVQELGPALAGLRTRVDSLLIAHAATKEELACVTERNDALLRSTSWRITAPLRWIRGKLAGNPSKGNGGTGS